MSKHFFLSAFLIGCSTANIHTSDERENLENCQCIDIEEPVCSTKNNITYKNECEAKCASEKSLKKGICTI